MGGVAAELAEVPHGGGGGRSGEWPAVSDQTGLPARLRLFGSDCVLQLGPSGPKIRTLFRPQFLTRPVLLYIRFSKKKVFSKKTKKCVRLFALTPHPLTITLICNFGNQITSKIVGS